MEWLNGSRFMGSLRRHCPPAPPHPRRRGGCQPSAFGWEQGWSHQQVRVRHPSETNRTLLEPSWPVPKAMPAARDLLASHRRSTSGPDAAPPPAAGAAAATLPPGWEGGPPRGSLPPPLRALQGTHRQDQLLDTVGGHAVQVGEVQLHVDLVAEHVLAERAPQHGLDRVLRHGVDPQAVDVRMAVLAVGALVHLRARRGQAPRSLGEPLPARGAPPPPGRAQGECQGKPTPLTCSSLSDALGHLGTGDSERPGKDKCLEGGGGDSACSCSAWGA